MRVQGKEETGAGDKGHFLTAYQNSTKCFYVLLSHTVLEALMKMTILGFLLWGGGLERDLPRIPKLFKLRAVVSTRLIQLPRFAILSHFDRFL